MKRTIVSIAISFVLIHTCISQTNTALPTFSSSTQLVLIPTIVTDKSDNHVSGLTRTDFSVTEDGKERPIAIFEEIHTVAAPLHRTEEGGTFSNFDPVGTEHHRLTVIVLDFINTPFQDQAAARESLMKFLIQAGDSREPMCVLSMTRGGVHVVHDFTSNPKLLADAVRKISANNAPLVEAPEAKEAQRAGDDPFAKLVRSEVQGENMLLAVERKAAALATVRNLKEIAKAFRGLSGRKSLIWASSGFPYSLVPPSMTLCEPACPAPDRREVQELYEELWRIMNDGQIAIYSIDLRQLSTSNLRGEMDSAGFTHPYERGDRQFDRAAQAKWEMEDSGSTLRLFAENTGGKAFTDSNDLIRGFRQAIDDNRSYYVLGYYVARNTTKPGWHRLSVSLHRTGMGVRYRNGYLLTNDISEHSAEEQIRVAMGSPLDFTGIPLSATWTRRSPARIPGMTKVEFELMMPADFATVDAAAQNHILIDVAAEVRDEKGTSAAGVSQRIDAHLRASGLEQIQHHGLTYHNLFELAPGSYSVHFVVRDSLGDRVGSLVAPLTVAR